MFGFQLPPSLECIEHCNVGGDAAGESCQVHDALGAGTLVGYDARCCIVLQFALWEGFMVRVAAAKDPADLG